VKKKGTAEDAEERRGVTMSGMDFTRRRGDAEKEAGREPRMSQGEQSRNQHQRMADDQEVNRGN
jgi:hypothetical protein